jgi:hypothetical protein
MPNWSYTNVTITGPDAEIERFKQACLFTEPPKGGPPEDHTGIDFERIIPMPKIEWPKCWSPVDDALVFLGRPDLHVCSPHRRSEQAVEEAVKQYPDSIAQAHLAIAAHTKTGFASPLDWACKNWGTKWTPRVSEYFIKQDRHKLYLVTAWSPPIPVLEKIVALFPALTLGIYSSDDVGNYFVKGTISTSGTDLQDDHEVMQSFNDAMEGPHDDRSGDG